MNERIIKIRTEAGLSQEAFAEKVGLTRNYISLVENGNRKLADRTVRDICRKFTVNYEGLAYGSGDIRDDVGDAQAIVDSLMQGDNEFAKKAIVNLAKLSEEKWLLLKEILEELQNE